MYSSTSRSTRLIFPSVWSSVMIWSIDQRPRLFPRPICRRNRKIGCVYRDVLFLSYRDMSWVTPPRPHTHSTEPICSVLFLCLLSSSLFSLLLLLLLLSWRLYTGCWPEQSYSRTNSRGPGRGWREWLMELLPVGSNATWPRLGSWRGLRAATAAYTLTFT